MLERNPLIEFHGVKFQIIGDAHFGKPFRKNVKPGQRETLMLEQFSQLVSGANKKADYLVIVGDLFDTFRVHNETLAKVCGVFLKECVKSTYKTKILLIPGNHDEVRDRTKISSYKILGQMLRDSITPDKLVIAAKGHSLLLTDNPKVNIYLDCYTAFGAVKPDNPLHKLTDASKPLIAFGHWDDPRSSEGYLPDDVIFDKAELVISGHIHTPDRFMHKGVDWWYVGSMQPYNHKEDRSGQWYVTYEIEEIERIMKDDAALERLNMPLKNVRVNCYPGYQLPQKLTCMSLIYNHIYDYPKHLEEIKEHEKYGEDHFTADFTDFTTMYMLTLRVEHEVPDDILAKVANYLKDSTVDEFYL